MTRRFLEDLEVGEAWTSEETTIDAQDIIDFARRFDPQPFHLDEATAALTFFKGLAASGWHTAAMTMKLLVEGGLRSREASLAPVWKR